MTWKPLLAGLGAMALFALAPKAGHDTEISVIRVPHGGIQPEAVLDGTSLHLLYYKGDPKAGDLFYVKSTDFGATWSEPLRVNSESSTALAIGTIRGGQLAIGRSGRVHVAWNGSSTAESEGPVNPEAGKRGAPMLYSRLNDAGTAFEPARSLMRRTFGLDGGGAIAADRSGDVYVAWHGKARGAPAGEAGREVWLTVSRDDGRTFATEEPAWNQLTGACGCCGMGMFADSKGVIRVLYRSATEDVHRDIYLLTSADHAHRFNGRKLHAWDINACPMSSMSLAEGAGEVLGAWETGGQVFFEQLTKANASPVNAPGDGTGRKHPRIAVAGDHRVLMIWTEGTGWQKGGSLAWQEFDSNGRALGDRGSAVGVPIWSFGSVIAKTEGFLIIY